MVCVHDGGKRERSDNVKEAIEKREVTMSNIV